MNNRYPFAIEPKQKDTFVLNKFFEKVLVNRKVFCIFICYYNEGTDRKEGRDKNAADRRMEISNILMAGVCITETICLCHMGRKNLKNV